MKIKKISVNTSEGKYPILIGNELCSKLGNFLKKNNILSSKVLLVIDNKVPINIIQKIKKSLKIKILRIFVYCYHLIDYPKISIPKIHISDL